MNAMLEQAVALFFTIATPFILLVSHKLLSKLADKLHLDNTQQYNQQLDDLIKTAISYVEKLASTAAKNNETPQTPTAKLDTAVQWLTSEMARLKMPAVTLEKLTPRIEAQLQILSKENE